MTSKPEMSDYAPIIVSVVAAAGAIISAIISHSTKRNLVALHLQINSRMEELLKLTEKAARAEGVKEQKDKQEGAG